MYHGTEIERGKRILEKQEMEYSRGGHEWLGDGIYLYRDKLFAYRWITIQHKNKFKDRSCEHIFQHYLILKVDIDYNKNRVFSFLNPEHQIEYSHFKEQCKRKAELSKSMSKYDFVDGVIINLMFKKMGYDQYYDMVEAVFPLTEEYDETSRLVMLTEYQLCVKNPEKILSISDCTEEFQRDNYRTKFQLMNKYRSRQKNITYRSPKRRNNNGKI